MKIVGGVVDILGVVRGGGGAGAPLRAFVWVGSTLLLIDPLKGVTATDPNDAIVTKIIFAAEMHISTIQLVDTSTRRDWQQVVTFGTRGEIGSLECDLQLGT